MKKIRYLILLLSLSSCEIELEDMYLTRQNYESDILRIDGYYYSIEPDSNRVALCYFFYKNGVCYYDNSIYYNSFSELEELIIRFNTSKVYQKYAVGWGVFSVIDSTLIIEKYSQSALNKKLTALFSGEILNDTTFTLNERYKLDENGEKYDVYKAEVTYHFRQYPIKPDSTNNYIK